MILSKEQNNKFRDIIADRCGLYFKDHSLKNLEKVVKSRIEVNKFKVVDDYYKYIVSSEKKEEEIRELLNLLTINHTYFFRNQPHFKTLKEKVLPELIKRKLQEFKGKEGEKPCLRIWSAGCSSGEEAYTIAMTVKEVIPDLDKWNIEISGTDASGFALEKARKAVYPESALRLVNDIYREKYFTKNDKQYLLSNEIKQMVDFNYLNLIGQDFLLGFDIIFCRNVVIYFEIETTIEVLNKFYSSLDNEGYLFVGYSESLQFISEKFKMQSFEDSIFYRKLCAKYVPEQKKEKDIKQSFEEYIQELSLQEVQIEKKEIIEEKKHAIPAKKIEEILVQIVKAFHLKEYDEAFFLIDEAHKMDETMIEPYYVSAEIYTNKREFEKAKQELEKILKIDNLFAPVYYLTGSICFEQEKIEEAKENLRKALYLDRNLIMANFILAAVYKKEDKKDLAIRVYRNTLKTLQNNSLEEIVAYSQGFNTASVISICANNIERLKYIEEK
jgi:chemotaxis protein methyltransferase CheR